MPFLSTVDQDKLRARFEQELQNEVRIVLFAEPPTGLYIPGRQESQTGRAATQLLEEVAALSPKLRLEVHHPRVDRDLAQAYGVERSPAIVLLPADEGGSLAGGVHDGDRPQETGGGSPAADQPSETSPASPAPAEQPGRPSRAGRVRFFGLPSGYEFMTLIEDVVDVSRASTRLSAATLQAVADLPAPVHLQVFVTPT
jgi:hypothetical protein